MVSVRSTNRPYAYIIYSRNPQLTLGEADAAQHFNALGRDFLRDERGVELGHRGLLDERLRTAEQWSRDCGYK